MERTRSLRYSRSRRRYLPRGNFSISSRLLRHALTRRSIIVGSWTLDSRRSTKYRAQRLIARGSRSQSRRQRYRLSGPVSLDSLDWCRSRESSSQARNRYRKCRKLAFGSSFDRSSVSPGQVQAVLGSRGRRKASHRGSIGPRYSFLERESIFCSSRLALDVAEPLPHSKWNEELVLSELDAILTEIPKRGALNRFVGARKNRKLAHLDASTTRVQEIIR